MLILFIIPFIIFLPWFNNESKSVFLQETFKPDIKINFNTIDSDQIKNLELFSEAGKEFTYIANDKNGKQVMGKISAISKNEVQTFLEKMGFKVSSIEETSIIIGRKEPFVPY